MRVIVKVVWRYFDRCSIFIEIQSGDEGHAPDCEHHHHHQQKT